MGSVPAKATLFYCEYAECGFKAKQHILVYFWLYICPRVPRSSLSPSVVNRTGLGPTSWRKRSRMRARYRLSQCPVCSPYEPYSFSTCCSNNNTKQTCKFIIIFSNKFFNSGFTVTTAIAWQGDGVTGVFHVCIQTLIDVALASSGYTLENNNTSISLFSQTNCCCTSKQLVFLKGLSHKMYLVFDYMCG